LKRETTWSPEMYVLHGRNDRLDPSGPVSRVKEWSRPPEPHPPNAGYWWCASASTLSIPVSGELLANSSLDLPDRRLPLLGSPETEPIQHEQRARASSWLAAGFFWLNRSRLINAASGRNLCYAARSPLAQGKTAAEK